MISKVRVKALKSIRDLSIECSNLNLFVGTNSSGKSTFLQASTGITPSGSFSSLWQATD